MPPPEGVIVGLRRRRRRPVCPLLDITQSMGRPGSALDNAVIESWHSTLEFELRRVEHPTTTEARRRVAAWIDDYNRDHRHSSIGMISPIAYERSLDPEPQHDPPQVTQRGAVLARIKATALRVASGQP